MMLQRSIYFPYLQSKNTSQTCLNIKYWQSLIVSFITLLGAIKYIINVTIIPNNYLEYVLSDPFITFGPARKGVALMFCLWTSTAWLNSAYFIKSHQNRYKSHQSWAKLNDAIEFGYFHNVGPFSFEVKIVKVLLNIEMTLTIIGVIVFLTIEILTFPTEYQIFIYLFFPVHFVTGYCSCGMLADFVYFYDLHLYLYAKVFKNLATTLHQHRFKNEAHVINYLKKQTLLYSELQKTCSFYWFISSNIFMASFCNQALSLFYLLFSNTELRYRLVLLPFAIINLFTGFMSIYFVASYARYQVKTAILLMKINKSHLILLFYFPYRLHIFVKH